MKKLTLLVIAIVFSFSTFAQNKGRVDIEKTQKQGGGCFAWTKIGDTFWPIPAAGFFNEEALELSINSAPIVGYNKEDIVENKKNLAFVCTKDGWIPVRWEIRETEDCYPPSPERLFCLSLPHYKNIKAERSEVVFFSLLKSDKGKEVAKFHLVYSILRGVTNLTVDNSYSKEDQTLTSTYHRMDSPLYIKYSL